MPFALAHDGVRLYYEVSGEGEPLLLIAGQASDHHMWNPVRGDFAKRYRVIVDDHRGTGQSDKPERPPYTTPGFARDAIAVLDDLGLARAHVYGASMGGAIGHWLGIRQAGRIGALVLACSSPGSVQSVRRPAEVQALITGADPKVTGTFFAHQRGRPQFLLSPPEAVSQPMPEYAERLHAQAGREHDAWDHLPEIKAPTLILHGSDDHVIPAANAPLLAERIPGAELHLVRGGRHMFFIEYRAEVNPIVMKFLARHPLNT